MRLLIADDDRTATALLATTLQQWKLEISVVHDGGEAWDLLADPLGPSLAILDWSMPRVDGPELCRRVRRNPMRSHIYLILLTARESQADVIQGIDAGADDYLIKPVDPEELRARVQAGIRVVTLQERLAERVVELQDALSRVKQLTGLLPICSYCKRIRTDENYWEQVDHYMGEHTDVKFTHGICPACYKTAFAKSSADPQSEISAEVPSEHSQ
jgi:DNA-binding response OmpR family regulator